MPNSSHFWLLCLVLFSLLTLSGCSNVSRFEKGPIIAYGEPLDNSKQPLYYSIYFNAAKVDDPHVLNLYIKFSKQSPSFTIKQLTPSLVAKHLAPFIVPSQWPETWKAQARQEESYAGNGFHIRFKDNKLLSIGLCSHCSGRHDFPIIGTTDGNHFYTLPITEPQLIQLFGKANKLYKTNEVRY